VSDEAETRVLGVHVYGISPVTLHVVGIGADGAPAVAYLSPDPAELRAVAHLLLQAAEVAERDGFYEVEMRWPEGSRRASPHRRPPAVLPTPDQQHHAEREADRP
jgi:hypothetical protein